MCVRLLVGKRIFHEASPKANNVLMVAPSKPSMPVILVVQTPLEVRRTTEVLFVADRFDVLEVKNEVYHKKDRFERLKKPYKTSHVLSAALSRSGAEL